MKKPLKELLKTINNADPSAHTSQHAQNGINLPYFEYTFYKYNFVGDFMKRSISSWQLMGFAVTSLSGTLLHFLYDWLGEAVWIAPFSSVNESTWEHMKLLFFPMFVFAIIQSLFFKDRQDFWCIKLKGILLGIMLIPILFYTYNGAIGRSPDWINIAIFFISAAIAYIYETRQFNNKVTICRNPKLAIALLCVIAVLFVVFTFLTPKLGIFKDPLTSTYGI